VKRIWSEDELHEHWSLSREEQALLARKTSRGQLGFALLLKAFELETRFPVTSMIFPPLLLSIWPCNWARLPRRCRPTIGTAIRGASPPGYSGMVGLPHPDSR
jgi:hypothetical protein